MPSAAAWAAAVTIAAIATSSPCAAAQTPPLADAQARADALDLAGAEARLAKSDRADVDAQVALVYVRGLMQAREAARQGGTAASLAPVRDAIDWLEVVGDGVPGPAEIARLMLHAAAAAAQSERDEMRLYLEAATQMEMIQHQAGLPGAPLVPAAATAGDLWLQVHRYGEARRAYEAAADLFGRSPRVQLGLGRAARGENDVLRACRAFRALLEAWRAGGEPPEIADARLYVAESCEDGRQ